MVLSVEHPQYARYPFGRPRPVTGGQSDATITLAAAGKVAGRVVGEDGAPIARARVIGWPLRPVTADAEGRFQFSGVPPGEFTLVAEPPGQAADWIAEPQSVQVREGEEVRVPDLRLVRVTGGGTVVGRTTDADTGQPLAGVGLRFVQSLEKPGRSWRPAEGPRVESDADGRYQARLPPGRWHANLENYPSGYEPKNSRTEPSPILTVAAGETATRDFQFQKLQELRVRIVEAGGRPVPGARVRSQYSIIEPADRNGHVLLRLSNQEPGEVRLSILAPHLGQGAQVTVSPDRRQGELLVRLERLPRVSGQVMDEQGQPLPGAWVRGNLVTQHATGSGSGEERRPATGAVSDAQGRFSFLVFPRTTMALLVGADGYTLEDRPPFEVPGDEHAPPVTIRLRRADQFIAGVVVDPDGKPIAGADVSAYWQRAGRLPMPSEPVTTDAQGRFRIEELPRGEVQILASMDGYSSHVGPAVQTGATDLRLVFVPTPPPVSLKAGDRAPEIRVSRWVNGEGVAGLEALRGKTVVLLFTSAFNPAAKEAEAALKALHAARQGDVVVLALLDPSPPDEEVAEYVRQAELPFPVGLAELGAANPTFQAYGVRHLPSLMVIDGEGLLRSVNPAPGELSRIVAAKETP